MLIETGRVLSLRGPYGGKYVFLVISIVIDSDRGHCWEHLKEINLQ